MKTQKQKITEISRQRKWQLEHPERVKEMQKKQYKSSQFDIKPYDLSKNGWEFEFVSRFGAIGTGGEPILLNRKQPIKNVINFIKSLLEAHNDPLTKRMEGHPYTCGKECFCQKYNPQPIGSKECGHECTSSCYKDYDCPCDTQHEHSQPEEWEKDQRYHDAISEFSSTDDDTLLKQFISNLLAEEREKDEKAYQEAYKMIFKVTAKDIRADLIQELEREVRKIERKKYIKGEYKDRRANGFNEALNKVLDILEKAREQGKV